MTQMSGWLQTERFTPIERFNGRLAAHDPTRRPIFLYFMY